MSTERLSCTGDTTRGLFDGRAGELDHDVDVFLDVLQRASSGQFHEGHSVQLTNIWLSRPELHSRLSNLIDQHAILQKSPQVAEFLYSSLSPTCSFLSHFPLHQLPDTCSLSAALSRCYSAVAELREDLFLRAFAAAVGLAAKLEDRWLTMKAGFFCLNKLGRYDRAQACALLSHGIALELGEEACLHRSRYAVLRATRLAGNANTCLEHLRELDLLRSGDLRYEEANQALVPSYTALHLMDMRAPLDSLPCILGLSQDIALDCCSIKYSLLAELYYQFYSGKKASAESGLHQMDENIGLSKHDIPFVNKANALAKLLCTELRFETGKSVERASSRAWQNFDLVLE